MATASDPTWNAEAMKSARAPVLVGWVSLEVAVQIAGMLFVRCMFLRGRACLKGQFRGFKTLVASISVWLGLGWGVGRGSQY